MLHYLNSAELKESWDTHHELPKVMSLTLQPKELGQVLGAMQVRSGGIVTLKRMWMLDPAKVAINDHSRS